MDKSMKGKLVTVWYGNGCVEAQVVEVYPDGDVKVITADVIGKSNVFIARPQTTTKLWLHRRLE